MRSNLRVFLTVAFTLIATVPVIYLALWVERTALENEISAVREKHLLVAKNITSALERYAADLESTFNYLVAVYAAPGRPATAPAELLLAGKFGIECLAVATFGEGGRTERTLLMAVEGAERLPPGLFDFLRSAGASGTRFTPVMAGMSGKPLLFIYRRLSPDTVAVAAIDPGYFIRLQEAIAFGLKGHAAIVDQTGRVIAHPKK